MVNKCEQCGEVALSRATFRGPYVCYKCLEESLTLGKLMTKTTQEEVHLSIDKSKTFRKSVIIFKKIEPSTSVPLAYISKPKHISQEEFDKFLDLFFTPNS
jgi:hypothetical protein